MVVGDFFSINLDKTVTVHVICISDASNNILCQFLIFALADTVFFSWAVILGMKYLFMFYCLKKDMKQTVFISFSPRGWVELVLFRLLCVSWDSLDSNSMIFKRLTIFSEPSFFHTQVWILIKIKAEHLCCPPIFWEILLMKTYLLSL